MKKFSKHFFQNYEIGILMKVSRAGGNGGAIAPPIFLKLRENVTFSTPNISRLVHGASRKVISTPNILHLPPGLLKNSKNF